VSRSYREKLSAKPIFYVDGNEDDITNTIFISSLCDAICTLRNFDNGINFFFDKAVTETNMAPEPSIKVTGVTESVNSFTISPYQTGHAPGARSVAQSFAFFWKRFIEGIEKKEVNITSGINSVLVTNWMEQIYNKIHKN
jgi:hypothetical protein